MNTNDISTAKDPDLRSSLAALRRASALARKRAIQTDTNLVVVMDGRLVFIEPKSLRKESDDSNAPTP